MKLSAQLVDLEKQKLMPDLNATVFQGTNNGTGTQSYTGFQVGVAVPLWFGSQKAQIQAAKTGELILAAEHDNYKLQLLAKHQALQADLRQLNEGLTYYESAGKTLAKETIFYANQAYVNGEINFLQYTQLLENAKTIEVNYLNFLLQYNMSVLEMNYLMN
jgi:cobalt-zinc-cadmium resistance protein CzcA